ncbi:MAG TPA: hypothetical protein VGQ37_22060 [Vicinamibacterales bacterium]|nr:hypothetical protein [Vicinamibacterales bacterium]
MLRFVAIVAVAGAAASVLAQQATCDRTCLNRIADAYIAALVAHDPAKAPLAPNVTFTEQAQVRAIGEGLWKTAIEGPTTFKIPVADPVAGQIGVILMMMADVPPPPARAGGPAPAPGPPAVQLALRLKVQNQKITEAEHTYAVITAPGQLANLQEPRKAFFQPRRRPLPPTAAAARTACTRPAWARRPMRRRRSVRSRAAPNSSIRAR